MIKKSITTSASAEYLTYISALGQSSNSIDIRYQDENIWLTQKMMALLYGIEVNTINEHINKVFSDNELVKQATIRDFRIVQTEGTRQVERLVKHYNLHMIIAVGFKVNNEKAVQFRKWANSIVKDYTIQGWVMDDVRLKNGAKLTQDYFDKMLQKVREIRLSERRFYQKITDIYTTSLDYDSSATATQRFFASVQNKLHYSIHGFTAAQLIVNRADAKKPHMGLTSWEAYPDGKIQSYDVVVAKNYLSASEIAQLERIVSSYLDFAESQAMRHIPMTMQDWEEKLNGFLTLMDRDILQNSGKISAQMAKLHALTQFEQFRPSQDATYLSDFDKFMQLPLDLNTDK